jgi:hypothetical protein
MAIRKGWNQLSQSYRNRLSKGGMTEARYNAGESLKKARGHAKTPENRRELEKHPEKFGEYRERQARYRANRKHIQDRVIEKKRLAFEYTLRWNEENSRDFVRRPKFMTKKIGLDVRAPTMAYLRKIDAMGLEEFIDYQFEVRQEDDWRFLWYH